MHLQFFRAALAVLFVVAATTPAAELDVTLDRMKKDIFFLAGEECEGRGVQTDGIKKAADYVAAQFKAAGLKPAGPGDSYFQPFNIAGQAKLGTPNTLVLSGPDKKSFDLKYGTEFTPSALSDQSKKSAGLVFVGYGITSQMPKYDDYADVEVKGKFAVILRQAPRAEAKEPPFDPQKFSPHPALASKLNNAVKHGAVGVIFVNHKSDAKDDALMPFGYAAGPDEKVPVFQIKRAVLEKLLAAQEKKLTDIEAQIDEELKPKSVALTDWTAAAESTVTRPAIQARNVVGVAEGTGPLADETIVIGAHYDHLGRGEFGSLGGKDSKGKFHYGADDNGSGTTGLIELARRFGGMKDRLGRRVVFCAFSGEEIDLLGSKHYCKNPLFPLEKTAMMVNMDMIGRSGLYDAAGLAAVAGLPAASSGKNGWAITQRLVVNGIGTGEGFDKLVQAANKTAGFNKLMTRAGGTGPSDHDSFYRKKVPVLFLYTGAHRDYHRPTDTPEKIDLIGMSKVVAMVEDIVGNVAEWTNRPKFVATSESWADPTEPATPRRGGPKLGIMPGNYESADGGVLVDDVSPGGAAEKGGIKAGDVIIEIGGKPVKNINGYMGAMSTQKAGQATDITVMRKDKKVTLKVTPTQ